MQCKAKWSDMWEMMALATKLWQNQLLDFNQVTCTSGNEYNSFLQETIDSVDSDCTSKVNNKLYYIKNGKYTLRNS